MRHDGLSPLAYIGALDVVMKHAQLRVKVRKPACHIVRQRHLHTGHPNDHLWPLAEQLA